MVLPLALENSEVVLNGIEVGRIRRQEQQSGSGRVEEFVGSGAFVEGRAIHHDDVSAVQQGTQCLGEPRVEEGSGTASLKQERGFQGLPHPCGNERRTRAALSGPQAVDPLPFGGISVAAGDRRSKAAFVDIDHLFPPPPVAFTQAQIRLSFPFVALFVAQRFFPGDLQPLQPLPKTMPGDTEVPGALFLRRIGMLLNMRAQGCPVQPPWPTGARALVA